MKKINRKIFLKTAAISTAAVGAGFLPGCSTENNNKTATVITGKNMNGKW